jgi:hypothetical protein
MMLAPHLPGNRGTLGCQALFKYKQLSDLASYNTTPDVNQKSALKMCFCGCVSIIK